MLFRVLILFLLISPARAQEFEVASLKLTPVRLGYDGLVEHPTGGPGTSDPGMFRCAHCRMAELITLAFDLKRSQLDLSRFLSHEEYEIAAKIPAGATPPQFRTMLQNLLRERLGLAYHYEKQRVDGYALSIAKGGPKLQSSAVAEAEQTHSPNLAQPLPDKNGYPILTRPGRMSLDGRTRWRLDRETIDHFAYLLEQDYGLPFENDTALTGLYDIDLRWSRPDGPTFPEALQSQLGLRMESKKVPVDVLIVDRLEKNPRN
jgi:uncharacterized protein (TIGR03435 family)